MADTAAFPPIPTAAAAAVGPPVIVGSDDDDTLIGTTDNDVIQGLGGSDTLSGSYGNDQLAGGEGADTLFGGPGDDSLDGGSGNDFLYDTDGSNTLSGGDGDDELHGSGTVDGGDGEDRLEGAADTADSLTGGDDTDTFLAYWRSSNPGVIDRITDFTAGLDGDLLDYSDLLDNALSGYQGNNPFGGGFLRWLQDGADALLQVDPDGGGNAFVTALILQNVSVSTLLAANFVPDFSLSGVDGAGIVRSGTATDDSLSGTVSDDHLLGLGGSDELNGSFGNDLLEGGTGSDLLLGGSGNDQLAGDGGNDTLYGGQGDDHLSGGAGNDRLNDLSGQNLLSGDDGDDELSGSGQLSGGAGADLLQGSDASADTLTGGSGNDTFVASWDPDSAEAVDRILDFTLREDVLDYSNIVRNALTGYSEGNPYAQGFLRWVQDGTDALLQVDTNGGGDAFTTALRLDNIQVGNLLGAFFIPDDEPDGSIHARPEYSNPIPPISTLLGQAFTSTFSAYAFTDEDLDDTLSYTARLADGSPLPTWLRFAPETRTFSGTPGPADRGWVEVMITATDSTFRSANGTVTLTVDDYAAAKTTTATLNLNSTSTVWIDGPADIDWFRVELTQGIDYHIDLQGSETSAATIDDPFLNGIYDASGTVIADTSDDDGGTGYNSHLAFRPASTGIYFIAVQAYEASRTGTMMLSLSTGPNQAPSASDHTIASFEDQSVTLSASQFSFADADASNTLASVRIESLPAAGSLLLNGNPVVAGQTITAATLNDGALVFVPVPNAYGQDYAAFAYSVSDGIEFSAAPASLRIDVAAVNDSPTGSIAIGGAAIKGQTLTASSGTLADADGLGTIVFHWLRSGIDTGVTGANYPLSQADVGATLAVIASYTDLAGTPESVASSPTATIANFNNPPTGSVTIGGSAIEGQTLSASSGTLADGDGLGALTYRWLRSGVDTGVTGTSYLLTQADVGALLSVVASYTDLAGNLELVAGSPTSTIANLNDPPTGAVTISGSAIEGQTLSAANTLADRDGLGAIAYRWLRDGQDTGTTGETYRLTAIDIGGSISVMARYTDLFGTTEQSTSDATAAVRRLNLAPVAVDGKVSGSLATGWTLNADHFGFTDGNGDALYAIRIVTRPRDGQLLLDGIAVQDGQEITRAALDAGRLVYQAPSQVADDWTQRLVFGVSDGQSDSLNEATLLLSFNTPTDVKPLSTGSDTFKGNNKADLVRGGDGNDILDGKAGNDQLFGEGGNDNLKGDAGNDYLSGGADNDVLDGGAGNDILLGGSGNDTLKGAAGNDNLAGGEDADVLDGGAGNDVLAGDSGNDTLKGAAGNDTLIGGAGNDLLDGGAGKDVYRYLAAVFGTDDLTAGGTDTLKPDKGDKIVFDPALWASLENHDTALSALPKQSLATAISPVDNIALNGRTILIDLDDNGVFDASADFQIVLLGKAKLAIDPSGAALLFS